MMPDDLDAQTGESGRGRSLILKAETALQQGDRTAALKHLEAASRFEPHRDDVHVQVAMLRHERKEYQLAALAACRAWRARPFNPPAMNLLGVCCIETGLPELAEQLFRRLVRIAPGYKIGRRNLKDARRRARQSRRSRRSSNGPFPTDEVVELLERDMSTLSVCVIARGTGSSLDRCLEPLKGLATDFVILDTSNGISAPQDLPGSIDILPHPWRDDYSDAWNRAIGVATSHWILLLEDDEMLLQGSVETLRSMIGDYENMYYPVTIRMSNGRSLSSIRLLRNAPDLMFTGRIQEIPTLTYLHHRHTWGLSGGQPGLVLLGGTGRDITVERQAQLVQLDMADNPESINAELGKARIEIMSGRIDEALQDLVRIRRGLEDRKEKPGAPLYEPLAVMQGYCLMRRERYRELQDVMSSYHKKFEPNANTRFLAGVADKATGKPEDAVRQLRQALDASKEAMYSDLLPEVTGSGLPNLLGAACIDADDLDGAVQAFATAMQRDPDNIESRLGMIGVKAARNLYQEVLEDLDEMIRLDDTSLQAWTAGAMVLGSLPGLGEAAVAWLEEASRRFPGNTDLMERLGAAHLMCGTAEQAMEAWNGLTTGDPAAISGRVAACLLSGGDIPEVPSEYVAEVTEAMLDWYGRWMLNGAFEALDKALTGLQQAAAVLPGLGGETATWLEKVGQDEAARRIREMDR